MCVPWRRYSAPTPLGPSNLWALDRATCPRRARSTSSSRCGAAWTASTAKSTPAVSLDPTADLGDRLDRPHLVVREHDRDEDRLVGDRGVDARRGRHGRSGRPGARRPRTRTSRGSWSVWPTAWCSTDEVTIRWPRALPAHAAPFSAEVVGLGTARREDDLAGLGADPRGDPLVGVVERRARRAAEGVRRRSGCRRPRSGTAASPRGPRGGAGSSPRGRDRSPWRADCTPRVRRVRATSGSGRADDRRALPSVEVDPRGLRRIAVHRDGGDPAAADRECGDDCGTPGGSTTTPAVPLTIAGRE